MGGLSLASALKVAYLRGKFASSLAKKKSTRWGMVAVGLSVSDIQPYVDTVLNVMILEDEPDHLHTNLTIACVNSPKERHCLWPYGLSRCFEGNASKS